MEQLINILIVHYNTPELTEACVKSINKHTPNCKIYIFDNSDKKPFAAKFDNVEIIDNTKGLTIDFDRWLELFSGRFDVRNPVIKNSWGSAKHCYTVQKFFETFDAPFILMDSDILIKKDFSELWKEEEYCIGESKQEYHFVERIFPFICFINAPKLKQFNVNYFNGDKMHGLSKQGKHYDTGSYFLEDLKSKNIKINKIKYEDYCIHFGAGSWYKLGQLDRCEELWLNENKELWK